MHFVNGDRFVQPVVSGAVGQPLLVLPSKFGFVNDNRRGAGAELKLLRVRVGFL